jgi:shikimate dehydrogenase
VRIGSNTRLLAVLGDPIAHSLSPTMHNAALDALGVDAVYVGLRISSGVFSDTFRALGTLGIAGNVTVPHKEAAERDVTRKTDLCARAGACNTYWVEQGALVGDNTDVPAIAAELAELGVSGGHWLVVGTGGSARAAALAAADAHADLSVHSRDAQRATDFAAWASGLGVNARVATRPYAADVVVNATPLGLASGDPLPLDPDGLHGIRAALDLVYGPGETRWARELRRRSIATRDGRGVLVRQGALAWERFFPDRPAPVEIMRAAVERALRV